MLLLGFPGIFFYQNMHQTTPIKPSKQSVIFFRTITYPAKSFITLNLNFYIHTAQAMQEKNQGNMIRLQHNIKLSSTFMNLYESIQIFDI